MSRFPYAAAYALLRSDRSRERFCRLAQLNNSTPQAVLRNSLRAY